nr:hypothetical protein [Tanacetum cinerariifolium]
MVPSSQQMVFNSPYLTHKKELIHHEGTALVWFSNPLIASWLVQKQTALGKDSSNPLIVDSLLKTIWFSIHHHLTIEVLAIPGQTATGVNTPRSDEDRLKLMELMVFLMKKGVCNEFRLNAARLSKFLLSGKCDVTRLQALVDKKKIVISEEVVHEILQLNDAEGVICLPMRRFLLTNIADLSKHTTRYISLVLTQKVFANMRRVGKGFSRVETTLFESMLAVRDVAEEEEAQVFANMRRVGKGFSGVEIPLFESMLAVRDVAEEEEAQVLDTCSALVLRIKCLENANAAQQLEIVKLKAKLNKFKSSKLRRLKKVGTSQRVKSSDDVDNVFNQGRISVDMDQDKWIELVVDHEKDVEVEGRHADKQAEIYNTDLDHSLKVLSMQEDDTEVQEAVEVVTTAKLMTEVVTAAATQVVAASTPVPAVKPKTLTITAAPAVSTRRKKRVAVAASTPIPTAKPKILNIAAASAVSTKRRKGVVIRDPKEELPSDILAETPRVKDKGKGILIEAPKPMKKKDQTEMDAEYARKL